MAQYTAPYTAAVGPGPCRARIYRGKFSSTAARPVLIDGHDEFRARAAEPAGSSREPPVPNTVHPLDPLGLQTILGSTGQRTDVPSLGHSRCLIRVSGILNGPEPAAMFDQPRSGSQPEHNPTCRDCHERPVPPVIMGGTIGTEEQRAEDNERPARPERRGQLRSWSVPAVIAYLSRPRTLNP